MCVKRDFSLFFSFETEQSLDSSWTHVLISHQIVVFRFWLSNKLFLQNHHFVISIFSSYSFFFLINFACNFSQLLKIITVDTANILITYNSVCPHWVFLIFLQCYPSGSCHIHLFSTTFIPNNIILKIRPLSFLVLFLTTKWINFHDGDNFYVSVCLQGQFTFNVFLTNHLGCLKTCSREVGF